MKITRRYSSPDRPVTEQVAWRVVEVVIPRTKEKVSVEVPKRWSDNAAMILADKYLRKAGVPDKTE